MAAMIVQTAPAVGTYFSTIVYLDRPKIGASRRHRCVSIALCLFTRAHRQHAVQETHLTACNRAARRWVAQRRMTSTLILACATTLLLSSTVSERRNVYSKEQSRICNADL